MKKKTNKQIIKWHCKGRNNPKIQKYINLIKDIRREKVTWLPMQTYEFPSKKKYKSQ